MEGKACFISQFNDFIHECFDIDSADNYVLFTEFDFKRTNAILKQKKTLDDFRVVGIIILADTTVSSDLNFEHPKLIGYLNYKNKTQTRDRIADSLKIGYNHVFVDHKYWRDCDKFD